LQTLDAALQEKGIAVSLPAYPPVLYKRRGDSDEAVLTAAVQAVRWFVNGRWQAVGKRGKGA
jgi:hypothetical protein